MANRKAHVLIGAAAGGLLSYWLARQSGSPNPFAEGLGGAFTGALLGLAPDLIEPATSPSHRGTAHSLAAGALVLSGLRGLGELAVTRRARAFVAARRAAAYGHDPAAAAFNDCFVSGLLLGPVPGYVSHLMADAATPMGLPIV